jgi:hypothetical protein
MAAKPRKILHGARLSHPCAPDCRVSVELLKTRPMRHTRDHRHSLDRAAHCGAGPFARTTMEFAAVPDHVRLPGRFFGRFTTAASSVL